MKNQINLANLTRLNSPGWISGDFGDRGCQLSGLAFLPKASLIKISASLS